MPTHTEEEILQAFKVLSDVVNSDNGTGVFVRAFADEHPTLQMGFYRALNEGLLLRLRQSRQPGVGIRPADGSPLVVVSDQRIASDAATFAVYGYLPRV